MKRARHGGSGKEEQMRLRIAQEAARVMLEDGIADFHAAKRKAALHLGAVSTRQLPSNTEIEQARAEYQRLFLADEQAEALARLRAAALQAMEFLAPFRPRLVGSVLAGSAGTHSDVNLHLFAEPAEEVGLFLEQHGIPYTPGERRLRYHKDEYRTVPSLAFVAGEVPIELCVFPLDGERQAPLSAIDGRPLRRAAIDAVRQLEGEETAAFGG